MTQVTIKKISELTENPENPRKHSDKQILQISQSIKEFGFTNPLLIDEKDIIIAGHGRYMAAKKAKLKNVPCIVLDNLSKEQKKALVIADNKLAINSSWDEDLLWKQIKDLTDSDFDINLIGFELEQVMPLVEEDDLVVQDLLEEWQGMPDYEQDDKTSFRSVIVHFEGEEEVKKFFKLIKQNHTEKTKSIWFPEQINMDTESKRYD